ncbi:hypothetical protein [Antrihabitans sp. YC2-6]|uniref:hypothetical protein n=1 Tax=Antrihabitans sp. YC2-6 TaxID=2799498 RepID=UPI0018F56ECB|nr:hypothetical protein [Antrihabitans sp. YC2-6]MBJ8344132.1 hypothetical protein [Antrihabitans sp. YC2-6]
MIATIENKTHMTLLQFALKLDAVVTAANGVAYLVAATLLDDVLGPETGFLRAIGLFLLAYGVAVWVLGSQQQPSRPAVALVIGGNAVWATASIVFAIEAPSLTTLGTAWTAMQAGVVGGFAALQWLGLRSRRLSVSR